MDEFTLDPNDVLAEARAATGLDDLGDPSVLEGLGVYCDSVSREARLTELGQMAVRANVTANLAARLRVVDWGRTHAEALAVERVESPLVVLGLFRAGTTLLSYLLDRDPQNRSLLRWESADPVPPPTPETWRNGPRVEAVRASAAMLDLINPGFKAIHHEEADGPTECVSVMAQDFTSLLWETITNVPSYGRWLSQVDQTSVYAHHELVLRILQSGGVRGRWTLKSPHHVTALEPLHARYPDATLVVLHRDPQVLCASVCSLISSLTGTFSDADHRAYIADHWVGVLAESVERLDRFRTAHPEVAILDLHYADLVTDPIRTVERIADASRRPLSATARQAIGDYLAANPKGRFGAHHYDAASLGLDTGAIEERFAGYIERYAIPRERRA